MSDREKILKLQATLWYCVGLVSLLSGVIIGFFFIKESNVQSVEIGVVVYQIIKSLVVVGLLVAASRYSFNLGKTYMNEALKNADRIHAISFGKFYLQVFRSNIKPEDLKDVFKDWNTSQESAFVKLDSGDFDPKMFEAFSKFIEAMKSK